MNAIELENIAVRYGRLRALDKLSLHIPQGQALALVGPNGAGKSTLLQVLTGLIRPQSGRVTLQGIAAHRLAARYQRSFSPQHLAFPTGLKVKELIPYVLASYPKRRSELLAEWTHILGCEPLLNKWSDRLSGGENKRLSLLLALAADTPIVILDEPSAALDRHYQHMLAEALQRLRGERTIVFVSHDEHEIMAHADRRVYLNQGQCVADQALSGLEPNSGWLHFYADSRPELPHVVQANQLGLRWSVQVQDTDLAVRALINSGEVFRGLEIQRGGSGCTG